MFDSVVNMNDYSKYRLYEYSINRIKIFLSFKKGQQFKQKDKY